MEARHVSTTPSLARGLDVLLWRPRPAWALALVRILFGLVLLAWTASMMLDASTFLADDGAVGPQFAATEGWRWFDLDTTTTAWIALVVLALAAVAITVGLFPGAGLLAAFVLLVAIERRNPVIINSGDLILRNLALLLALCPTGAALSVDRWRRHGRASLWTSPLVAPWGLRLVQLQIVVVYFFAFWSKSGSTWRSGAAVSTALRLDDLQRFSAPWFMIEVVLVVAALTWGALAIELLLAGLLWCKPLRLVLIALAVALHVSIGAFMLVGFFGPVMIVGLLTFLDADRLDERIARRCPAAPSNDQDGHRGGELLDPVGAADGQHTG